MKSIPPVAMPTDSAMQLFEYHQHFMERFADQNEDHAFDQQFKTASVMLLAKIAHELEKLNASNSA